MLFFSDSSGEPVNKMRRTSSVVLEQDNKDKLVVDNILNNKMIEQVSYHNLNTTKIACIRFKMAATWSIFIFFVNVMGSY